MNHTNQNSFFHFGHYARSYSARSYSDYTLSILTIILPLTLIISIALCFVCCKSAFFVLFYGANVTSARNLLSFKVVFKVTFTPALLSIVQPKPWSVCIGLDGA